MGRDPSGSLEALGATGHGASDQPSRERDRLGFVSGLREFIYGMAGYEFARQAVEMRTALESVFMVTVVGDMIGLPVLPPYYSLRLLPYAVPRLEAWKRRLLRERHALEHEEYDLIEL